MANGIMQIRGRPYATVWHRAQQAHGNLIRPTEIASTVSRYVTIGDYLVVVVTVTFLDGRVFEGSSEITRGGGGGGGAQALSPVETAETSAYGRALAMAGWYGSGDGLAGYEEVTNSEARATVRVTQPRSVNVAQTVTTTVDDDDDLF